MKSQAQASSLPRPHDIQIEQQLLGALLLNNDVGARIFGELLPGHFADSLHQRIYDAIESAVKAGGIASAFTLKNEFEADEDMKAVGGATYLAQLTIEGRNCLDPPFWARTIKSMSFRRALVEAARQIESAALEAPLEYDAERMAEMAEEYIGTVSRVEVGKSTLQTFQSVGSVASRVLTSLLADKPEPTVKLGLAGVDDIIGGVRPGELIIVGARPGMGKTALAAHIAKAAAKQGAGVAFFSMEMSAEAIALRLATSEAYECGWKIAYESARKGNLPSDQAQALLQCEGRLRQLPLYLHEGRNLTPSGIYMAARRAQTTLRNHAPLGLIVVDHIQKIRPERDMRGNKVAEMTEVSDALQKMAGQLGVPVVALSQLNRAVEGRTDKRPELSDLRESGSIEQDADIVLLLYREAYYVNKKRPHPTSPEYGLWQAEMLRCEHVLDVQIAKHRNGREGSVRVYFDGPSSALKDW